MQKKIRAREYRNKAQFARDLTLIWENCLKYNADVSPESFSHHSSGWLEIVSHRHELIREYQSR